MLQGEHSVILLTFIKLSFVIKVSKGAKIRNRYNQVPHLTLDTNGKVTNSQMDTTNEGQEISPFPAGNHKAKPLFCLFLSGHLRQVLLYPIYTILSSIYHFLSLQHQVVLCPQDHCLSSVNSLFQVKLVAILQKK